MKKILLVLISAFIFSGCDSTWHRLEDCISSVPEAERTGIKSASIYVEYYEYSYMDFSTMSEKRSVTSHALGSCYLTCEDNYTSVQSVNGPRCLANQAQCSESELPANAISGYKNLLSNGSYGACQIMICADGYLVQSDNTCGSTVIIPPPPPTDPCIINPFGPLCPPMGPPL